MKTVPIIGTTLGYITCRLIDSAHMYKKFCGVDPYLIDFMGFAGVHLFVEVGKEEPGDEPFILPPGYLFGCLA